MDFSPLIRRIFLISCLLLPACDFQNSSPKSQTKRIGILLYIDLIEQNLGGGQLSASHLEQARAQGVDAVLIMPDPVVQVAPAWQMILEFARSESIPIVANNSRQVREGALFPYHADAYDTGAQASQLAANILKGWVRSVEVISSEPQLVLNKQVADLLKLEFPDEVLALAKQVIR